MFSSAAARSGNDFADGSPGEIYNQKYKECMER